MTWTRPQYSKEEINRAGRIISDENSSNELRTQAEEIVNNHRSSHAFPLNTFQVNLRNKAKSVDESALVAQRIKRLPSITKKLHDRPQMKLTQMQDIGGCRATVDTIKHVRDIQKQYERTRARHVLASKDDYIESPRSSGYRGVHLVYRYVSERDNAYDGLKIEIQLRSALQHAWATAVEVVGTFTRQALKSSQGREDWLRFFALMSSAAALIEGTPTVPDTPQDRGELISELKRYTGALDVKSKLIQYGNVLQKVEESDEKNARFFLMTLDSNQGQTTITGYKLRDLQRAQQDYLNIERQIASTTGAEAVLVAVESFSSLRRAYPNYFLDTKKFVDLIDRVLKL